jgi:hypothetical protein
LGLGGHDAAMHTVALAGLKAARGARLRAL